MKKITKKTKIIIASLALVTTATLTTVLVVLDHIAKKHSAHAVSEIKELQSQMVANIVDSAQCQVDKSKDRIYGKYGHISISGDLNVNVIRYQNKTAAKTGCLITYNFNQSKVSGRLAGKKLVVDLYNSGFIKAHPDSTIDTRYQDLKPLE